MDIALWTAQWLLAAAFAFAGVGKLGQPVDKLAAGMGWVEDYAPRTVKAIGALEVAAAIALVAPPLFDTAPALSPLAATGLVLMMIGAAITHGRRGEWPNIGVNAILLGIAAFVAWGRFGTNGF